LIDIVKEKKIKWGELDTKIQHEGSAIKLPSEPGKMPLKDARDAIDRKMKEEETVVRVFEIIEAYPHDAAVAFMKALKNLCGWASPVPTPGFFGNNPPTFITIKTGLDRDDVVQCPIGSFKIPNVENELTTQISPTKNSMSDPRVRFIMHAQVKHKDRHVLIALASETRRIVEEESIYRGKALELRVTDDGSLNMDDPPSFIDTSMVNEASLLFDEDIMLQIDTNILVPLKHETECRQHGIPPKRGVLLAGPYGTGKSLTAAMVARVCEDNNITFILLNKVQGLRAALEVAVRFGHSVVFAEDVDRIADHRDDNMNDLINVIDGVVSKTSKVMTILTTNFVEKLDPVILRPGRLDAVIALRAPSASTVQRLIRHYAGDLLEQGAKLTKSGEELKGQIPATIRECVERAKLGMIGRRGQTLTDQDILTAALTMKNHLELLNRKVEKQSVADALADSFFKVSQGAHLEDAQATN